MYEKLYNVLEISYGSNKDEIKSAYRKIALLCHPDKLNNVKDDDEKVIRINKFKEATNAYNILMNDNEDEWENINWEDEFSNIFNISSSVKNTFIDIAKIFINNNIHPKSYYNPKNTNNIIEHNITFKISYNELKTNCKKKLRLILVDIEEPIFIEVYCNSYPFIKKTYIDDDDVEHDINLSIELKKMDNYEHIINNNIIDLITTVELSLSDYILGSNKKIKYIDGKTIDVYIPPFQDNYYELNDYGINGGSMILNIEQKTIDKPLYNNMSQENKDELIRILNIMTNK